MPTLEKSKLSGFVPDSGLIDLGHFVFLTARDMAAWRLWCAAGGTPEYFVTKPPAKPATKAAPCCGRKDLCTPDEFAARETLCRACEKFISEPPRWRCGACNCPAGVFRRRAKACPLGKFAALPANETTSSL